MQLRRCQSQTCGRFYGPTDINQKYCCPPCSKNEATRRKKKRKDPYYGSPVVFHSHTVATAAEIYMETKIKLDKMQKIADIALDDKDKLRRRVDELQARDNEWRESRNALLDQVVTLGYERDSLLGYNQEWQEKVDQMRQEMNEQVAATQEQSRTIREQEAKIAMLHDFNMRWQTTVVERDADIRELRRLLRSAQRASTSIRNYPYG